MKGELIIEDNEELEFINIDADDYKTYEKQIFNIQPSSNDFAISVFVNKKTTLEKQLKKKKDFYLCLDDYEFGRKIDKKYNEKDKNLIDFLDKIYPNILDKIEYVVLALTNQDELDFIKRNPILLTKRIVLAEKLYITDYDKLLSLMDKYKDVFDKIYVTLNGNEKYISLIDCYKTISTIKKQADDIKKLNLSPMETIMYVYDQVRNKVYKREGENEAYTKSRDLSEVLFGDKIVCAGYANMFYTYLDYLGIKSQIVYLDPKDKDSKIGHVRNIIYINDKKYNIDGVYYFDLTEDRKRNENENLYLYSYNYFAKTRGYMDQFTAFKFNDRNCPNYSLKMLGRIKKIIQNGEYNELFLYVKSLNYMAQILNKNAIISPLTLNKTLPLYGRFDKEKLIEDTNEVLDKFNKPISAEVMIRLLTNVRKIEYYQNPKWYPYSLKDIYKTYENSSWEFKDRHLSPYEKTISIVSKEIISKEINDYDNFKNYCYENEFFKDVEQVKLAKVLRLTYDKRTKEDR